VTPAASSRNRTGWQAAILIALVLAAYLPLWRAGFVWDDDTMLTANRLIRAGDGLVQFWFTRNAQDYWPVTSTTLWVEWRLWGLNPLGYHLTNLALHLGTVLLLWSVLRRLCIPGAWLAALLFAVHPINVESVTWIAQRKNLLALLFALLTILCFLKSGIAGTPAPSVARSNRWYWLGLIAFILAMLSKGSVAPLPLVLAGVVAWRRRPTLSDCLRLIPFFIVAGVLAAVDVWFQRHGTHEIIRSAPFLERLLGAGGVVWFYLSKSFWPARLMFVYPQWHVRTAAFLWWIPLLGVLGLTVLLWRLARRESLRPPGPDGTAWGRGTLFAWGYFCVSLVPVLGFTDVYFMKFSLVADHYAHLALIGVVAWAGFVAHELLRRAGSSARVGLTGLIAVAIAALAVLTWRQNGMYRDSLVLYRTILEQNPDCWMAHNNLAIALEKLPGGLPEALIHYEEAARIDPGEAYVQNDLARALAQLPDRVPEALDHYEQALRINPDYAEAHNNLAAALAKLPGRLPEALAHYEQALRINPDFAAAHVNLALELEKLPGRLPDAVAHFEQAARINPEDPDLQNDLAVALAKLPGRLPDAVAHFELALRLNPNDADLHYNLANQLMKMPGRLPDAMAQYEEALRIRPDFASAHYNLGVADAKSGRYDEAARHFGRVLELDPGNSSAREILERLRTAPK
jgi:tetratricopeptide (TPR) repeat protein